MMLWLTAVLLAGSPTTFPDPAEQFVCRKDPAAYAHALRECQIMAKKRKVYHALGCAKGTRYSGVGMSYGVKPRHCYSQMDTKRLVARAFVKTKSGARYWSAHYR